MQFVQNIGVIVQSISRQSLNGAYMLSNWLSKYSI